MKLRHLDRKQTRLYRMNYNIISVLKIHNLYSISLPFHDSPDAGSCRKWRWGQGWTADCIMAIQD